MIWLAAVAAAGAVGFVVSCAFELERRYRDRRRAARRHFREAGRP